MNNKAELINKINNDWKTNDRWDDAQFRSMRWWMVEDCEGIEPKNVQKFQRHDQRHDQCHEQCLDIY